MRKFIKSLLVAGVLASAFVGCKEEYKTYSDAEYVLFQDTLTTVAVEKDKAFFEVPVISTVTRDYDRTVGVEVIDNGSNAIEKLHYQLESNSVTIKAGETVAKLRIYGKYDQIKVTDSLRFQLQLVMPDQLEMSLYGKTTNILMMKSCPFDINNFTGYCVVTSMFLYKYSTSYQRLIYTEKHPTEPNTIICHNWLYDGYDVTMKLDPSDPLSPRVTMDEDQVMSDEGSVFGVVRGDDKILVTTSPSPYSYFYGCQKSVALWSLIYVEKMGVSIGTVGSFYNVMEWVSDEEADRLQREEGM